MNPYFRTSHAPWGALTNRVSHSTADQPAASSVVARNTGNRDSLLTLYPSPRPLTAAAFIRRGGRPVLHRGPGNVAAVICLELLVVNAVAREPGSLPLLPRVMKLRCQRGLRQVLRQVPAKPVQAEDVLVPEGLCPHPDEPHVKPPGQE